MNFPAQYKSSLLQALDTIDLAKVDLLIEAFAKARDEDRQIFDICLASVHSHFDLSEKEQTARLIRAMEEPCVRILGHMRADPKHAPAFAANTSPVARSRTFALTHGNALALTIAFGIAVLPAGASVKV